MHAAVQHVEALSGQLVTYLMPDEYSVMEDGTSTTQVLVQVALPRLR